MHDHPTHDNESIQTLATGRFLRMVKRGRWEYVERPHTKGAVAIIAVTDAKELILVEQHRVPLGKRCIELPAGLAGDLADAADETFTQAAGRELLEETGYRAAQLTHLYTVATSPGLTSETIDLYRAAGLTQEHEGGGDEHEDIVVHAVPINHAAGWLEAQVQAGKVVDVKVYLAVELAKH